MFSLHHVALFPGEHDVYIIYVSYGNPLPRTKSAGGETSARLSHHTSPEQLVLCIRQGILRRQQFPKSRWILHLFRFLFILGPPLRAFWHATFRPTLVLTVPHAPVLGAKRFVPWQKLRIVVYFYIINRRVHALPLGAVDLL